MEEGGVGALGGGRMSADASPEKGLWRPTPGEVAPYLTDLAEVWRVRELEGA